MFVEDSKVNFIGSVSFEGNHATSSGGKGNLKIRFQQNDKHEYTLWYFSAIDKRAIFPWK